jgi:hypothetical protein
VLPFAVPGGAANRASGDKPSEEPTLEQLVARFKPASRAQILAFVGKAPTATLVRNGERATTARVRKDGVRLFTAAADFLAVATPAQKQLLLGLTETFLAAGVSALSECVAVGGAAKSKKGEQVLQRGRAVSLVEALEEEAATRRDVLYMACVPLAGGDPAWTRRLDDAWSRDDRSRASLADSLARLATEARALALDATARGVEHALDETYLQATADLAEQLKGADEKASAAVPGQNVTQGDVNWWRGACIWFIKTLVDIFASARRGDPRIPAQRLATLKSLFAHSSQKPKRSPAAPPAPQPPQG